MDIQKKLEQPVFKQILKQQRERGRRSLPYNQYHGGGDDSMDRSALEAYERYVLAQFKFSDAKDIEQERMDAINSLIPGTKHYYHLYFLNLVKQQKQLHDFTEEEAELYLKFDQKYGGGKMSEDGSTLFYEVETWLKLINPLEKLPKMSETTSQDDAKKYCDIIDLIKDKYLDGGDLTTEFQHLSNEAKEFLQSASTGSDSEEAAGSQIASDSSKIDTFQYEKHFSREKDIKDKQAELNKSTTPQRSGFSSYSFSGFEEDLDWSKCDCSYVYQHAVWIISRRGTGIEFFEITNESFFQQLGNYFKLQYEEHKKKQDERQNQKIQQFRPGHFFNEFTIDQLDKFKKIMTEKGYNIKDEDKSFIEAYFSKVFSTELSAEGQENMSHEDKLSNLQRLYSQAKSMELPKSLLQNLVHEMLTLTIKLDGYEEDLFKQYLQFPLERSDHLRDEKVRKANASAMSQFQEWNVCLQNVQTNSNKRFNDQSWHSSNSSDVIPKYLEHICQKHGGSLKAYEDHFDKAYLAEIEKKVQVFLTDKGLLDLPDQFDPKEFKRIQDEVLIRFKDTNKEQFKVEEAVNLFVEIKNVPELQIKVFQFNTETYYKKTLQPFDTTINLQGMVPSHQRTEKDMFKSIPKNKIQTQEFKFDELKGKVGLFIIEFQGNGKMSRVIVKKGSLSLIHRSTAAGHIGYIIDADRKICKSDRTGVWIDKKFYKCDPEKNGSIFIPYGLKEQAHKIIMIHDDFAQLGDFLRKTEEYQFQPFFHLNSEQILVGQEAQILIRPRLRINGRKASAKLFKNCNVKLEIKDYIDDRVTSRNYDSLQFNDDQETIISFQVPPNMASLTINMEAQVQNVTKKKLETFTASSQTFQMTEHRDSSRISELYLRRINKEYFVYALGRNGEPQTNGTIEVRVKHKDYESEVRESLSIGKHGRVGLGLLKDVERVHASFESMQETWMISTNHIDTWTQSEDIHIIQGENVEIPVNFDDSKELQRYQASLKMAKEGNILKNFFDRIKLVKAACGMYHVLNLVGLEVGEYRLCLKMSAGQRQTINITVHKGTYWEGNFILKKSCLLESSAQKNAIRLEKVDLEADQALSSEGSLDQQSESKMTIQLQNFSNNSRVHLYATQFMPNYSDSLRNMLEDAQSENIAVTTFPFAQWKNMYESNNTIADEIRYVFDRQKRQNKMGNTLDRPTMLMKRNFIRTTETLDENLQKGTTYKKMDVQRQEVAAKAMYRRQADVSMSRKRKCAPGGGRATDVMENKMKDYQNFLSQAPYQCFNLKPTETGLIEVKIQDIQKYSQLFLIACDTDSVVKRQLDICELIKQSQIPAIPMRDLTVNKKVEEDANTGLTESRKTQPLKQGETVHIEDITSSKIQIIDNMEKIYQVMEQMKSLHFNDAFSNGNDNQFDSLIRTVLQPWKTFEFKKKCILFSKHTCHELNFFLFKRDEEFYNKVVKFLIQNKLEKTFVDQYMLASQLEGSNNEYAKYILSHIGNGVKVQSLNMFERCLLIEFCLLRGEDDHKQRARAVARNIIDDQKKAEVHDSQFNNGNVRIKVFEAVLNSSGLEADDAARMMSMVVEECGAYSEDEDDSDDNSFGDDGGELQYRSYGGGGGGGGPPRSNQRDQRMERRQIPQQQQIQQMSMMHYEEAKCTPQQPMMQQAQMMSQNIQPAMMTQFANVQEIQSNSAPAFNQIDNRMNRRAKMAPQQNASYKMMEKNADIFDSFDNSNAIEEQRQQVMNTAGFQELEKTGEYMETHYFKVTKSEMQHHEFYVQNRLFKDYVQYLLDSEGHIGKDTHPFLTDCFTDVSMRYVPFLFAWVDLPLDAKSSKGQHKYKSDNKRGINITAGSHGILFKKEIKEGQCQIKNDLMVTHRYQSLINYSDDDECEDMIVNHPYQCEVIMTNISPKSKDITLLYQIPNGSIPLKKTKYIDSRRLLLKPYTTLKQTQQFYFPKDGTFDHAPSNISQDQLVTARSAKRALEIGKKRIIKNVVTFKDMMLTAGSNEVRMQKILDLYESNYDIILDAKFKYDEIVETYFAFQNVDFYVKLAKIFDAKMLVKQSFALAIVHYKEILTNEKFKNFRSQMLGMLKSILTAAETDSKVRQYVFKTLDTDILEIEPHALFDQRNNHLEYFPIVNQRVFQIGGASGIEDESGQGLKEILNVQFKKTYKRFLHLLLHQDFAGVSQKDYKLELIPKLRLQLAFYLQLQDRVDEAMEVFKTVDASHQGVCQMTYDYMFVYFGFFTANQKDAEKFKNLRAIVSKYDDCHIEHFKSVFKKLKEQLDEIEEARQIQANSKNESDKSGRPIDASQQEEITEEQRRQAELNTKKRSPVIHEANIDENTGELSIESDNIEKLTIKYYLIDAEILFSRSPFVKDQAEQFSYVKPFMKIEKEARAGVITRIPLPDDLKGRNVVIEINSDDIQKFKTFYSSQLKVQLIEKYGELRVFNRETMEPLSKVYVKVFCKNSSGKELFYRDGFTDIRGKFVYATASGKSLDDIKKFSILICDDEHNNGSRIREVNPPSKDA